MTVLRNRLLNCLECDVVCHCASACACVFVWGLSIGKTDQMLGGREVFEGGK